MTPAHRQPARHRGVTLLEVMTAVSLSAMLMASSFVVLRSSYAAWTAHEADLDRAANATAVLRHIIQHARQATSVSAISGPADTSGSMTVIRADGSTLHWNHSDTRVTLAVDSATAQPLANDIQQLSFEGYEADGTTPTIEPDNVQALRTIVTTQLPSGGTRSVSSFTWLRSW